MFNIREYRAVDKEAIIKLVRNVLFEVFKAEAQNISDLDNIEQEYFSKKGVFYVAEDNKRIIGAIAVKKQRNKVARLKRLFVDKDYRKRKIGQRLLNKIIEFCKYKKYERIIVSTYPQMKAAIEFYKKNNFKEYERNERIFLEKEI